MRKLKEHSQFGVSFFSYLKRLLRQIAGSTARPDDHEPERSVTVSRSDLPKGFRYIRANSLLSWDSFKSYEQIRDGRQDAWFEDEHAPPPVLFVSHRWEKAERPDPHGVQLKALQIFIRAIASISSSKCYGVRKRCSRVPSLMDHGVLQAAVVVAAGQLTSDETNLPEWQYWSQMWSQAKDRLVSEEFNLRNIGIWYDFSCMPQDAVLLASREPAGNAELQENLSILHELVACCPVIALRTENDSYKQRGWWAAGTFYR